MINQLYFPFYKSFFVLNCYFSPSLHQFLLKLGNKWSFGHLIFSCVLQEKNLKWSLLSSRGNYFTKQIMRVQLTYLTCHRRNFWGIFHNMPYSVILFQCACTIKPFALNLDAMTVNECLMQANGESSSARCLYRMKDISLCFEIFFCQKSKHQSFSSGTSTATWWWRLPIQQLYRPVLVMLTVIFGYT